MEINEGMQLSQVATVQVSLGQSYKEWRIKDFLTSGHYALIFFFFFFQKTVFQVCLVKGTKLLVKIYTFIHHGAHFLLKQSLSIVEPFIVTFKQHSIFNCLPFIV